MSELTPASLREFLDYDPDTGIFTWKVRPSVGTPAGRVAGGINGCGYRTVTIAGATYQAHRLAWLYMHGHWPDGDIDHRDGVRDHNAIANLREATRSQNGANAKTPSNNTSGYKGVSFHRSVGKWQARIKVGGRSVHLGYHLTPESASAAYDKAACDHFGAFARWGAEQPIPAEAGIAETC